MKELLQQAGYVLVPSKNIWSEPGYEGIAYSDGDEIEQRIAAIINNASDLSVLSTELRQHCSDWPSLYHLSSTRANILRPFANTLKGDVLEIGAGCGAITRYLGECGANVLALEGSPRRAAIARSRTRDLENITVLTERFDQFRCDHKFDFVTLIGVLEYANLFTGGETPAQAMLEQVKKLLKPTGKLIIAIENQLGLKYFAGAPEDHIGVPMYGVEGRYRKDQPQTFGRIALTNILNQAGFEKSEFMAPFPDYKLPTSIVTESGFLDRKFDAAALIWQSVRRDPQLPPTLVFSPELVWPTLAQNQVALDFSNSFLIVARPSNKQEPGLPVLAWHFSTERAKEFCKETRFLRLDNGSINVQYHLLSPGSSRQAEKDFIRFSIPEHAEYIHGRVLSQELIQCVVRDGWKIEEVGEFFKSYLQNLTVNEFTQLTSLEHVSADTLVPGELIDVIPQNIIVDANEAWHIIDKEWALKTDIPIGYLIFRSLLALFNSVTRFGANHSGIASTPLNFSFALYNALGFSVTDAEVENYIKLEANLQLEALQRIMPCDEFFDWLRNTSLPCQTPYQIIIEQNEKIKNLKQDIINRDNQIFHITQSKSWKMTKPFRFTSRLIHGYYYNAFTPIQNLIHPKDPYKNIRSTSSTSHLNPIAVVLPIYKNVKMTLDCIDSAMQGILEIESSKLVLINDASPDEGMRDALEKIARRLPDKVKLINNDINLGFVATVNKGMRFYPDHDIVLLNSDVLLPNGWLKRLRNDAYSKANVATVTPISNNTTICTFPEFLQDNTIPFGLDVQAVDNIFARDDMPCIEAPTGIGFCMFIKRSALNKVGYFNEERFGRGYGEENDFCQRAIKNGYINLISPNLYVYHQGGVSFGDDKAALIENAMKVIDELHPNFHADVQRFIAADPLRLARINRYANLIATSKLPKILHISHGIGGGVDQHIEELSDFISGSSINILLTPGFENQGINVYLGVSKTSDKLFYYLPKQYDELLHLFKHLNISLIHYHHTLQLNPLLLNLPFDLAVNHVFTIHDFFLLSGNPTLTNKEGIFPGNYTDKLTNPLYPLPNGTTPEEFRADYCRLIETAKAVIFPSFSTQKIFGNHYTIRHPVVAYHPEHKRCLSKPYKGIGKKSHYVIATIGAISKEKGADLLEKIATIANETRSPLSFIIIGYSYRSLRHIKTTGPYNSINLQSILLDHKIDACFFPAQCPETYSYALSHSLESGLPIIAPNIGAFPERLNNREGVLIFDYLDKPESILNKIENFIDSTSNGSIIRPPLAMDEKASSSFYTDEYLKLCSIMPSNTDEYLPLKITANAIPSSNQNAKEKLLALVWSIYIHPSMRWINYVVPFKVRRGIKRFLSRRPITQIINKT